MNLTYTVQGYGGLAPSTPPISNNDFWWVNSSGGVLGTQLANYGFDMVVGAYPPRDQLSGSLLLSSDFKLKAGETLKIEAAILCNYTQLQGNVGFAVLLQNSQLVAVLANLRAKGTTVLFDTNPIASLTPEGPGVTLAKNTFTFPDVIDIGGVTYGPTGQAFQTDITTTVESSIEPGEGSYQLLFGAFGKDNQFPTTIAVQSVAVHKHRHEHHRAS